MRSDIQRARRDRMRAERRAARERWLQQVSIEIHVKWPRGLLGAFVGAMFLLTPPLFTWLAVRIGMRLQRRRDGDSDPGAAA